jgi:predicted MFS family arabinose efflux permease
MAAHGWRFVFYIFGAAGIVWAAVWYAYYRNLPREHPRTNAAEIDFLPKAVSRQRSASGQSVPWRKILRSRDLWLLSLVYFCYGWVIWLYLAWFPTYLREARHFTTLKTGLASIPLLAATIANVCGGLLSDRLAARLGDLRRGRVWVSIAGFLIAAIALIPGVLADSPTIALASLTIALGGLELTVAVSWAICLDIGGDYSGSVSSVMNTWGNLGGAISAVMVGYLATLYGWASPFIMASSLCLLSALVVSRIEPRHSAV